MDRNKRKKKKKSRTAYQFGVNGWIPVCLKAFIYSVTDIKILPVGLQ